MLFAVAVSSSWGTEEQYPRMTASGTLSEPQGPGHNTESAKVESEWKKWEHVAGKPAPADTLSIVLPVKWAIRFFQKFISPVDGPSCSFSPTCSSYGLKAVQKHGVALGVPMTTERIMRNHDPDNPVRYPLVEHQGEFSYSDPVKSNDFWWTE